MNEKELKEAIAEVAQTAGRAANGRSAFAETLVRMVEPNHLSLDIFNLNING